MSEPACKKPRLSSASAISDCGCPAPQQQLPATVWGHVLDYLVLRDARNALVTSRDMFYRTSIDVGTLSVTDVRGLKYVTALRFKNASRVNVLCLVKWKGDHSEEATLSKTAIDKVVDFLIYFQNLKRAFLGGLRTYIRNGHRHETKRIYNPLDCTALEENDTSCPVEVFRSLQKSVREAYDKRSLPTNIIKGLYLKPLNESVKEETTCLRKIEDGVLEQETREVTRTLVAKRTRHVTQLLRFHGAPRNDTRAQTLPDDSEMIVDPSTSLPNVSYYWGHLYGMMDEEAQGHAFFLGNRPNQDFYTVLECYYFLSGEEDRTPGDKPLSYICLLLRQNGVPSSVQQRTYLISELEDEDDSASALLNIMHKIPQIAESMDFDSDEYDTGSDGESEG